MSDPRLVDVTLELRYETARAYLVSDDGKTEHWLPKSQVEYDPTPCGRASHGHSDVHTFTMPEWLAQKCGLI
jgi:hypothetical protein